jgi:hypothetical protein
MDEPGAGNILNVVLLPSGANFKMKLGPAGFSPT